MKVAKRKAKRIANRPLKAKSIDRNIYAGSKEALLNKVVEIVVKIIKKEIGYNELRCSMVKYYNRMGLIKSLIL